MLVELVIEFEVEDYSFQHIEGTIALLSHRLSVKFTVFCKKMISLFLLVVCMATFNFFVVLQTVLFRSSEFGGLLQSQKTRVPSILDKFQ